MNNSLNNKSEKRNEQLQKAKLHADSKGGLCLSNECLNSKSKLEWKCNNANHPSWFAKYTNVVNNGNWCKKCNIENFFPKEKYLQLAKEHAIAKGGKCLSTEYINNSTKMKWKCSNKSHKDWEAVYSSVINGNSWCMECGILEVSKSKLLKDGLAQAKQHAISKGGKCLSTEYIHSKKNLEWKCHNPKHSSWFISYSNVVSSGSWCPECGEEKNIQEFRVRKILNYLFDTDFIKTRKEKWNINTKTGRLLELDGYSEELKLAFEFQGMHHFKDNIYNCNTLEDIQYNDQVKKDNCIKNNVKLIIINEFKKNKNCLTFFESILNAIKEASIEIPKYDYEEIKKLYTLSPQNNRQESFYKTCINYAKSKNGYCLSKEYINNSDKMEWKCEDKNHKSWWSNYNHIVSRKSWCPECAINYRSEKYRNVNGLLEANKYAKSKNGYCLSKEYINNSEKMEWKCKNPEHPAWLSSYNNTVIKKRWCPKCRKTTCNIESKTYSNKIKKLEQVKLYAHSKNGTCLSKKYIDTKNKLEWKCENPKHDTFHKSFEHVISRKQWCPECYKERKNNL